MTISNQQRMLNYNNFIEKYEISPYNRESLNNLTKYDIVMLCDVSWLAKTGQKKQ